MPWTMSNVTIIRKAFVDDLFSTEYLGFNCGRKPVNVGSGCANYVGVISCVECIVLCCIFVNLVIYYFLYKVYVYIYM